MKKLKKIKPKYEPTDKDYKFAGVLRRGALRALKRDLSNWINDDCEDDLATTYEMVEMCLQDFKDLLEIAKVLETAGPNKAYGLVWKIDTSVRESIPSTAFEYFCND